MILKNANGPNTKHLKCSKILYNLCTLRKGKPFDLDAKNISFEGPEGREHLA